MEEKAIKDQEKENSIGKLLKKEREKAGLTQQQVGEALKLRPSIIDAIENEQWDRLPHAVFVKGFVKSYAKLLKVNLEEIPEAYNSISSVKDSIELPLENENSRKKRIIWISLIVFLVAITMLAILYKNSSKKRPLTPRKSGATVLRPLNKILTVYVKRPVHFPVILKLRTKKRIWLSIAIDKYAPERYMLEPGEYVCWQARESFELAAGDASGIELWINGIPVNFDKKEGKILYLYLKKKIKGVDRI
jgi:transcriptional regulator with XRE-family HTH domain